MAEYLATKNKEYLILSAIIQSHKQQYVKNSYYICYILQIIQSSITEYDVAFYILNNDKGGFVIFWGD